MVTLLWKLRIAVKLLDAFGVEFFTTALLKSQPEATGTISRRLSIHSLESRRCGLYLSVTSVGVTLCHAFGVALLFSPSQFELKLKVALAMPYAFGVMLSPRCLSLREQQNTVILFPGKSRLQSLSSTA